MAYTLFVLFVDWKCRNWSCWWNIWYIHKFLGTKRWNLPLLLQNISG